MITACVGKKQTNNIFSLSNNNNSNSNNKRDAQLINKIPKRRNLSHEIRPVEKPKTAPQNASHRDINYK